MLSREENELITRVGPDTPMGRTLRRYWMPALLASEIPEPDCPPVRVRLLGEDLVAFRDSQGRIGLLDELCPHRRASLYFGRNEDCGLRCVYHGWKFDVTGQCTDMMNEPAETDFSQKVRTPAYPTAELGGVIWAYLGPAEKMPPLPKFAWTQAPETHRHVTKVIQECNWLQGLEGGIDTSHAPILHRLMSETSTRGGFKPSSPFVRGKAPQLLVDLTDYGYQYAGIRPLDEAEMHVRTYQFILPFHQIRPSKSESGLPLDAGHCWVPMDDGTTMVFNWSVPVRMARCMRKTGWSATWATGRCTWTRRRSARSPTGPTTTCWTALCSAPKATVASTGSTCRIAPSRKAWGGSWTVPRNTWGRRTRRSSRRASCCVRR